MNLSTEEVELPFCESNLVIPGLKDMHFYVYDVSCSPAPLVTEKRQAYDPLYSAAILSIWRCPTMKQALTSHHEARPTDTQKH
jgi:hypothetical protein